jgi:hypothetical protein
MGEKDRDRVLSNCMEEADNPIPVIVNGEIVSKICERVTPLIGPENSKIIKCSHYIGKVNKLKKIKKSNVTIIGDSHCKGITISILRREI